MKIGWKIKAFAILYSIVQATACFAGIAGHEYWFNLFMFMVGFEVFISLIATGFYTLFFVAACVSKEFASNWKQIPMPLISKLTKTTDIIIIVALAYTGHFILATLMLYTTIIGMIMSTVEYKGEKDEEK